MTIVSSSLLNNNHKTPNIKIVARIKVRPKLPKTSLLWEEVPQRCKVIPSGKGIPSILIAASSNPKSGLRLALRKIACWPFKRSIAKKSPRSFNLDDREISFKPAILAASTRNFSALSRNSCKLSLLIAIWIGFSASVCTKGMSSTLTFTPLIVGKICRIRCCTALVWDLRSLFSLTWILPRFGSPRKPAIIKVDSTSPSCKIGASNLLPSRIVRRKRKLSGELANWEIQAKLSLELLAVGLLGLICVIFGKGDV